MLMRTLSLVIPNSSLRKKSEATLALWITFLLGRQAMFGHAPPTYLRSITTTRCPFCADVHAMSLPPAPLPRTTRSYASGFEIVEFILLRVEVLRTLFRTV